MAGKKAKKINYKFDGVRDGVYVRCWREGREYVVQVWHSGKAEGEPDGDWGMPAILGVETSVAQAVSQTPKPQTSKSK